MINVFLDQNHWIYLARAFYGKAKNEDHNQICQQLIESVTNGKVRLPLLLLHLTEFSKAENPSRRHRLAEVFSLFSQNWFLAPWSQILPYEIARAIDRTFGINRKRTQPQLFGQGVIFGSGKSEKIARAINCSMSKLDSLETLAAFPAALLDLLTFNNEPGRQRGVYSSRIRSERYAQSSEQHRRNFRDESPLLRWRAQAAMYTYEHQNLIIEALTDIGKSFENFGNLGPEKLTDFYSIVPTLDVDLQLITYRDKQWSRKIQPNDLQDIGYLVTTVPYCDVVVVEKFWADLLRRTGLDKKYNTTVVSDLSELGEVLSGNG